MKKTLLAYLSVGCVAASLVLTASFVKWYPLEAFEYKLYDLRMTLQPKMVSAPVVIVRVDHAALKQADLWPRAYIGLLIRHLHDYHAKVIGINMLLDEKEPTPGLDEIRELISEVNSRRNRIGNDMKNRLDQIKNDETTQILYSYKNETARMLYSLQQAEKRINGDLALSSSIAEAENVVLPVLFTPGGQNNNYQAGAEDFVKRNSLPIFEGNAIPARRVVVPLKDFARVAQALGHITRIADKDGVIRSEPLLMSYEGRLYPSFPLQLITKYLNRNITDMRANKYSLKINYITVPLSANYRMLINFGQNTPPSYSLSEIISGEVPPEAFKNKIVLLDPSGPLLRTPACSDMPDTIFIADIIGTILERHYITRPPWALPLETAFIIFSATVLVFSISRLRPGMSAAIAFVLLCSWSVASVYLFLAYGYWIKMSYQIALISIGCCALVYRRPRPLGYPKKNFPDAQIIKGTELYLTVGAQTATGFVRHKNEDAFCVMGDIPLLAVADGVGGQANGEVASRMAVDIISECLGNTEAGDNKTNNYINDYSAETNRLGESVRTANKAIYEASENSPLRRMGTTIAAAMLRGNRLSLAHVGDSRIYLVRSQNIEQLTDDHNLRESGMKHVLTQALGAGPDVAVDLDELTLTAGDIVILCTDGLNTMVSDTDILSAVLAGNDPQRACRRLVTLANKRGGRDNITVIVAYAHKK